MGDQDFRHNTHCSSCLLQKIMPSSPRSPAAVVVKLLLDQGLMAPIGTALFFMGMKVCEPVSVCEFMTDQHGLTGREFAGHCRCSATLWLLLGGDPCWLPAGMCALHLFDLMLWCGVPSIARPS
jgi:hypothetical protein